MFKLSNRSKVRREGVDPRLIEISDLAIQLTVVDFGTPPHGGVREDIEQNILFKKGFSKADGFIKRSVHQPANDGYGKGLDFYAFVEGKASWQHHHLAMVGAAHLRAASMLGYEIDWGGLWQRKVPKIINGIAYGWDMAHIGLVE